MKYLDMLKAAMHFQAMGMPLWAWIIVCLPPVGELINRSKWTKAQTLWQLGWRMVMATPLANIPVVKGVIAKMALTEEMRAVEAPAPAPVVEEAPKAKSNRSTKKSGAALIFFMLFPMAVSGCYCGKPENKDTARCIAQAKAIECMKTSILSLVPAAIVVVNEIISGGVVEWNPLVEALKKRGYPDAECLLAVIRDLYLSPKALPAGVDAAKLPHLSPDVLKTLNNLKIVWK